MLVSAGRGESTEKEIVRRTVRGRLVHVGDIDDLTLECEAATRRKTKRAHEDGRTKAATVDTIRKEHVAVASREAKTHRQQVTKKLGSKT